MGDALSKLFEMKDITEKVLPQHDLIYVASSSLQVWMEDVSTSTVETNVPGFSDYSFFGVYDDAVAKYIGTILYLNIFTKLYELGEENIEQAIKDGFMQRIVTRKLVAPAATQ